MDRTNESDTFIGGRASTPTKNNNNSNNNNSYANNINNNEHIIPVDPTSNYSPFRPTWSGPSTPSVPSGMSIPGDSIFKNMTSPSRSLLQSSDTLSSTLRINEEEDTLHIEKSRILEHLRHATAEVDELESRLQAMRRRRARAVVDALESHQKAQESEAKEMRYKSLQRERYIVCRNYLRWNWSLTQYVVFLTSVWNPLIGMYSEAFIS